MPGFDSEEIKQIRSLKVGESLAFCYSDEGANLVRLSPESAKPIIAEYETKGIIIEGDLTGQPKEYAAEGNCCPRCEHPTNMVKYRASAMIGFQGMSHTDSWICLDPDCGFRYSYYVN
jgi:hypothetical protein